MDSTQTTCILVGALMVIIGIWLAFEKKIRLTGYFTDAGLSPDIQDILSENNMDQERWDRIKVWLLPVMIIAGISIALLGTQLPQLTRYDYVGLIFLGLSVPLWINGVQVYRGMPETIETGQMHSCAISLWPIPAALTSTIIGTSLMLI